MSKLGRFLNPTSVVTFGGGWAKNVIEQLQKSGYQGDFWPVHPHREEICGLACYQDLASVPGSPDAAFIGVNREQTVEVVAQLNAKNAGGAICFASGFNEADEETGLQAALLEAAGDMPILGPNCYGFLNYVDNVCLWPDQHGGKPTNQGVAIVAQSSNIAINMSMQQRGLPLAYLLTVGNQAQIGVSDLVEELIANPKVTAIGLYLEGFDDVRGFERVAALALKAAKPIVVLKIGKTLKAQAATISHTATLSGGAAASSAFLRRLRMVEVNSITELLESLKLLSVIGPLPGAKVSSVSCSGGEASLMSDLCQNTHINFPDFSDTQLQTLAKLLGPKVDLANPLDYHTYIWGDVPIMQACFETVMQGGFDLNVFVLDLPREDICDPAGHECAVESIIAAKIKTGANVAVLGLLPENLSEALSERLMAAGVVPLHDMQIGLAAIDAAIRAGKMAQSKFAEQGVLMRSQTGHAQYQVLHEYQAKAALREYGLPVPRSFWVDKKDDIRGRASGLSFPLVLKGQGLAHKTEAGAVIVGISTDHDLILAIDSLPDCESGYLIEEMANDVVAELLIGVSYDSTGLCLLTIGAGGILAELLSDTQTLLLPTSRQDIVEAIELLKISALLRGYRGKPAADMHSLVGAIEAIVAYATENYQTLEELDINPLMVGSKQSIAVDALIRLRS